LTIANIACEAFFSDASINEFWYYFNHYVSVLNYFPTKNRELTNVGTILIISFFLAVIMVASFTF